MPDGYPYQTKAFSLSNHLLIRKLLPYIPIMQQPCSSGAALYIDGSGEGQVRRNVAKPEPGNGEILVQVQYSGCNPADLHHAKLGIVSTIMGYDFMGIVSQTGPSSNFSMGDLVVGYTPTGIGRPSKYGAHQEYLVTPDDFAWHVPPNVPHDHAAVLPVTVMTAADALYNAFKLHLPDEVDSGATNSGPMLIWGASTSVGIAMLQLARASGVQPIFVTASPGRHSLLSSLGATACFDYSEPDVLEKIEKVLRDTGTGPIKYGADCTGKPEAANKVATVVSADAKLVSMREQENPRFTMPFASKGRDTDISLPGIGVISLPAQPDQQARMLRGLQWAMQNYGSGFMMPEVVVVEGTAEEALERVKAVARGSQFGKTVLRHPLK